MRAWPIISARTRNQVRDQSKLAGVVEVTAQQELLVAIADAQRENRLGHHCWERPAAYTSHPRLRQGARHSVRGGSSNSTVSTESN